jgi:hypothetical protein
MSAGATVRLRICSSDKILWVEDVTVELKPSGSAALRIDAVRRFHDLDELLDQALECFHREPSPTGRAQAPRRNAVVHIRTRKGLTLGGLGIKDSRRRPDVSLVLTSVTMAWCFEGDATPYTEQILDRMEQGEQAWVPALWKLEVVNALLKAKRQGRVTVERAKQFLAELRDLAIEVDKRMSCEG